MRFQKNNTYQLFGVILQVQVLQWCFEVSDIGELLFLVDVWHVSGVCSIEFYEKALHLQSRKNQKAICCKKYPFPANYS